MCWAETDRLFIWVFLLQNTCMRKTKTKHLWILQIWANYLQKSWHILPITTQLEPNDLLAMRQIILMLLILHFAWHFATIYIHALFSIISYLQIPLIPFSTVKIWFNLCCPTHSDTFLLVQMPSDQYICKLKLILSQDCLKVWKMLLIYFRQPVVRLTFWILLFKTAYLKLLAAESNRLNKIFSTTFSCNLG